MGKISRFILTACVFCAFVNLTGCAVKSEKSIAIDGNFTELELGTGINVTYIQGPYRPVQIVGDKEKAKLVEVKREGDALIVRYRRHSQLNNITGDVKVTVYSPAVNEFDLQVGSILNVPDGITLTNNVEFEVATGATVAVSALKAKEVDIDCSTGAIVSVSGLNSTKVDIDCSTGSSVTLAGNTGRFEVVCSTGAVVNAGDLKAETGSVTAGTGAQVLVNVKNMKHCSTGTGATVTNVAR